MIWAGYLPAVRCWYVATAECPLGSRRMYIKRAGMWVTAKLVWARCRIGSLPSCCTGRGEVLLPRQGSYSVVRARCESALGQLGRCCAAQAATLLRSAY